MLHMPLVAEVQLQLQCNTVRSAIAKYRQNP